MVMQVIMMMRVTMKIMNSSSYRGGGGFANTSNKIVSPILLQKLINDFAVCKHCTGTFLLVEDVSYGFEN